MGHPSHPLRWSSLLLLSLLFVPALTGQETQVPALGNSFPAPLNLSHTPGLHMLDGALWGVGVGYRVRFDESVLEFTPEIAHTAEDEYPMSFRLESIGGDTGPLTMIDTGPRGPTFHDLRVEYERGVAIERYEIGLDGVEQSFVFRERVAVPPTMRCSLVLHSRSHGGVPGRGLHWRDANAMNQLRKGQ